MTNPHVLAALETLPQVSPFRLMTGEESQAYFTLFPSELEFEEQGPPSAHQRLWATPILQKTLDRLNITTQQLHECNEIEDVFLSRLRSRHWDIMPQLQQGEPLDHEQRRLAGQIQDYFGRREAQFLGIHDIHLQDWPLVVEDD